MMNNKFAIIISTDVTTKEGTNINEAFEYLKNNNVLDWGTNADILDKKQNIIKEGKVKGYFYVKKDPNNDQTGKVIYIFDIISINEKGDNRPEEWKKYSYNIFFEIKNIQKIPGKDLFEFILLNKGTPVQSVQRPVYVKVS